MIGRPIRTSLNIQIMYKIRVNISETYHSICSNSSRIYIKPQDYSGINFHPNTDKLLTIRKTSTVEISKIIDGECKGASAIAVVERAKKLIPVNFLNWTTQHSGKAKTVIFRNFFLRRIPYRIRKIQPPINESLHCEPTRRGK